MIEPIIFNRLSLTLREVGVRVPTRGEPIQTLQIEALNRRCLLRHLTHRVEALKGRLLQARSVALTPTEQTERYFIG